MSLQFILGSAGSGKSWHMYHEVTREAQAHPDDHYFVIVPEQFNMQTQRDLVMYSPHSGILNIDIVSFPRLAEYIFDETGTNPGTVLTDTGKNLVIRQAAVRVRDQLRRLGNRLDRPGCIPQIKSLLSEFAQYNISHEEIEEMIALSEAKPSLQEKLRDVLTISRSFDDYRKNRYITSEELLKVLAAQIPFSEKLRGAHLYFNGFTGFTPVQMLVMRQLLRTAESITVELTMDPAAGIPSASAEHDLFYLTGKTIRALSTAAAETGTEVLDSVVLTQQQRFARGSGMQRLERRLLRYGFEGALEERPAEDIHVIEAADPLQEAGFIAQRIWQLTHEEGCRYSDIAVICADLPAYQDQMVRVFEEYGIPCFLDHKNSVSINPCLEMIRGALRIVEENWSYASVFHFLRLGYTQLSQDETDLLENYVLAFGIRGSAGWQREWTRCDRDFPEDYVKEMNRLRELLLESLEHFLQAFHPREAQVQSYTDAVRALLADLHVEERLAAVSAELGSEEDEGENEEPRTSDFRELETAAPAGSLGIAQRRTMAMEYDQIWRIINEVLDEADGLLGNETVSRKEFAHILETGFDEARVGVIPPGIDEVCIGDMVRTRVGHVKILFLTGVCDGAVPSHSSGGSLLSQMERQFLADSEVELAPDARADSFIQRFYLYQTLTKPSRQLYVSFSQSSSGGDSLRPSYLIYHLMKILPGLKAESADQAPVLRGNGRHSHLYTPQQGYLKLASSLRSDVDSGKSSSETLALLRVYQQDPQYASRTMRLLEAVKAVGDVQSLGPDLAHRLYGSPLILSVSGLEDYSSCPFMYFVSKGLRLRERRLLQVAASDTGTFMHEAMYRFASLMTEDDWKYDEPDLIKANIADALQQTAAQDRLGKNLYGDSASNAYMLTRMGRAVARSAEILSAQIRAGEFVPAALEQQFAHQVRTADGTQLLIKGTIDRIDRYILQDTMYVRLVDYKSSSRKIDLLKYLAGAQLQLPLYLTETLRAFKERYPDMEIRPAALLYSQLTDPILRSGSDAVPVHSDEEAEQKLFMQKMRPNGIVNNDPDILGLLDRNLQPGTASLAVPAALKKDGSLKSTGRIRTHASDAELKALAGCTEVIVQNMAEQILNGHIEISPLMTDKTDTACTWCAYQDVCGKDPRLPAFRYRKLSPPAGEDIWDTIVKTAGDK